jgi:acetylornithine deacetylase
MYSGHMDTKPIGRRDEWASDPFDPLIRDGLLYGLGSSDMKSALAAMTYAGLVVSSLSSELQGELQLLFCADEEAGGHLGARFLSEECGLQADVALLGEPSGVSRDWEYLSLVSRGETCFRLRVYGTQMHSSISDLVPSVNANLQLAEVLLRLDRDLEIHHEPHPLCPDGITITPGVLMTGGVYYGMLPGEAECRTEIRTVPGMTLDGVRADVEGFVEMLRDEHSGLRIEVEFEDPPFEWIAPVEFPPAHPFVACLEEASEQVLGASPPRGAFPAWTDARFFSEIAGIPAIPSFGPGLLTVIHRPNEHVSVEAVIQAAKIYSLAAVTFLRA